MFKSKRLLILRSSVVAAMMLLATLVGNVFAASPASADVGALIYNNVTNLCVASDYKNAYVVDCGIAGIDFFPIALPNGHYLLQAHNTGLCLSNFDYFSVYPTNCNMGASGQLWNLDAVGSYSDLYNVGTGHYLKNDYGNHLALVNYAVPTWGVGGYGPAQAPRAYFYRDPRTNECLFMDNLNAYGVGCFIQGGDFYSIPLPNGYHLIEATYTGKCLSNFDYFNVYPANCDIYAAGQMWTSSSNGGFNLYNVGTGKWLTNDSLYHLALISTVEQWEQTTG